MDTASREMIYDVDPDTTIALRRQLGKAGSDYDRLDWDDIDVGEQELILDELQMAYEEGGMKKFDEVGETIIEQYGVEVDATDLQDFFDFEDIE
jgi:hypothetical protein